MFHAHVETFFHHGVIKVAVRARTHFVGGAVLVDVGLQAFEFETLLLAVEYCHVIFQCFRSGLLESTRPRKCGCSHLVLGLRSTIYVIVDGLFVLAWTWNIKLQALSVKHLIIVEPGRCLVKADILSREHFVIGGSPLVCPLRPCILEVILYLVCG